MASLAQHFLEMARNNAWANLRLHAACALLDDAALKAGRSAAGRTYICDVLADP